MKTRIILFILSISYFVSNAQNNNPYEEFGHKTNVVYETRNTEYLYIKNKDTTSLTKAIALNIDEGVVLFLGRNDSILSKVKLQPEQLLHWFSVDPLANKYPGQSPYNFVENNPIYFIDKDGRILWDPQAKKEVVYNEESKKFSYKDGSQLSKSYINNAMPMLSKLTSSDVGTEIVKSFQAVSTRVIIDENDPQKNTAQAKNANSVITPLADESGNFKKNSDGLYEEVTITPMWNNLEKTAKMDNMSVDEKLIGTMTVEWGHIGTKKQIDLEESLGGPDVIYSKTGQNEFAQTYNGLLNSAVSNEISYRNEKGIAIDKGVFQPILRVQQSNSGSKVSFNSTNQKAYDDYTNSTKK